LWFESRRGAGSATDRRSVICPQRRAVKDEPLNYALPQNQPSRRRWWLVPALLLGAFALFVIYFVGYWWLYVGLDRGP
jgi:hypothetical protein